MSDRNGVNLESGNWDALSGLWVRCGIRSRGGAPGWLGTPRWGCGGAGGEAGWWIPLRRLRAVEKGARFTRSRGGRAEWTSGTQVRRVTVW